MTNQTRIGLALLLIIFVFSAGNLNINLKTALAKKADYQAPDEYRCLQKNLPADQNALYFSKPDGTLDWDHLSSPYYRAQYYLAPRLVSAIAQDARAKVDFGAYHWFIAQGINQETLGALEQTQALKMVAVCGDRTILQRQTRP
jgi:hypothetical protein